MPIELECRGAIALVTLNRPEVRNAVDAATSRAAADAVREIETDPALRVGILTGAGDVFCAGADLKALARGELDGIIGIEGGFCGLTEASRTKPMIAAVNGHALAGGFELALACDMVVAEEGAEFGLPEVGHGIIAGAGGLVRLPAAVGAKRAMELALTGDRIGGEEALRRGFVNHLVPAGTALERAFEIASKIAANAPIAVEESRAVIEASEETTESAAWERNRQAWLRVRDSSDAKEGPLAFEERRPPRWTGR